MVKGIDHQTSGSVVVFMTSKLIAEIELGGDESNCFKKPPIMAFLEAYYKGFPELITSNDINVASAIGAELFCHRVVWLI